MFDYDPVGTNDTVGMTEISLNKIWRAGVVWDTIEIFNQGKVAGKLILECEFKGSLLPPKEGKKKEEKSHKEEKGGEKEHQDEIKVEESDEHAHKEKKEKKPKEEKAPKEKKEKAPKEGKEKKEKKPKAEKEAKIEKKKEKLKTVPPPAPKGPKPDEAA